MGRKSDGRAPGQGLVRYNSIKSIRAILGFACAIAISAGSIPHSHAEQKHKSDQGFFPGQGYILAGFSTSDFKSPKALNSYQGIIYAPFGNLSETGLILRAWNKAYHFTYETDLSRNARNIEISVLGLSVEGEVGWQIANDLGRIALYGGMVWRDHTLTPNDPGSDLNKSRIGFSATIDGEYKYSNDYGIIANASYLQGFNQYWVQAKPYIKFGDGWKIGLDATNFGGKDYHLARTGVFLSDFEFSLWPKNWSKKRLFLGAEAGVQLSFKDKQLNSYAGLNIGYLF